ncbi:hypothetical protein AgCh_008282 [Apium graveolens]
MENHCAKQVMAYGVPYFDGSITRGGFRWARALGHLAIKLAKAFGAHVTVTSTSESKRKEASEKLGTDSILISCDPEQMQGTMSSLDGIIDSVSATHPLAPLLGLLKPNGKLVMVGGPEKPLEFPVFPLLMGFFQKHAKCESHFTGRKILAAVISVVF